MKKSIRALLIMLAVLVVVGGGAAALLLTQPDTASEESSSSTSIDGRRQEAFSIRMSHVLFFIGALLLFIGVTFFSHFFQNQKADYYCIAANQIYWLL